MTEPPWLTIARRHLGLREAPGRATNPVIARWLLDLHAWWSEDDTPWCGTFCAAVMREAGFPLPKHWFRARAWLEWGQPLREPRLGAVVVFHRPGGGHVGFPVGRTPQGYLRVLGGNQSDAVTIANFLPERVLGYVWPPGVPIPDEPLPLVAAAGTSLSSNEA